MTTFIKKALTAVGRPGIAMEYVSWMTQRSFTRQGPVRHVCGVKIGNFNSFSEYHSMVRGVSPAELAFLEGYEFGEGAVIDIGANLGLFSLVMARRFPDRRIVAFEPAPSTFAALQANAALNGSANIECQQAAVADREGIASFAMREQARANSSLAPSGTAAPPGSIQIQCTTLDRFAASAGIDRIALLKVDVEGFESAVFRGAADVLARIRPRVVYFEVCPALAQRQGSTPEEAARMLQGHGYRLHRIAGEGRLEPVTPGDAASVSLENWVGLRPDG